MHEEQEVQVTNSTLELKESFYNRGDHSTHIDHIWRMGRRFWMRPSNETEKYLMKNHNVITDEIRRWG